MNFYKYCLPICLLSWFCSPVCFLDKKIDLCTKLCWRYLKKQQVWENQCHSLIGYWRMIFNCLLISAMDCFLQIVWSIKLLQCISLSLYNYISCYFPYHCLIKQIILFNSLFFYVTVWAATESYRDIELRMEWFICVAISTNESHWGLCLPLKTFNIKISFKGLGKTSNGFVKQIAYFLNEFMIFCTFFSISKFV